MLRICGDARSLLATPSSANLLTALACENVSDTPAGEDNGALVEVAVKYWCGNRNIHAFIWNQYRELVSDSLIEDILDENPTDAAELKRLTEALATRSRVYGEYNKEYNRKYRPSRL